MFYSEEPYFFKIHLLLLFICITISTLQNLKQKIEKKIVVFSGIRTLENTAIFSNGYSASHYDIIKDKNKMKNKNLSLF